MPKGQKTELDQVHLMQEMRLKGMTNKEIAKQLGICTATVSRNIGVTRRAPTKITEQLVEDMETYRSLGLSNAQIAAEMGLSKGVVRAHIGPQPDMCRSEYASLSAHTTGESYAKTEKPKESEKPKKDISKATGRPTKMKPSVRVAEFEGRVNTYSVTDDGYVTIHLPLPEREDSIISHSIEEFYTLLSELCDIGEYLSTVSSQEKLSV